MNWGRFDMLGDEQIKFVSVTDGYLLSFIKDAKERIIIAKPAYKQEEVKTILNIVKNKDVKCRLYLESGEESIRKGLGDVESLNLILKNFDILKVQLIDRIRIGIIIVDNNCLIYTTNISLLEENYIEEMVPNGLLGNSAITKQIDVELFSNEKQLLINREMISRETLFSSLNSELGRDRYINIQQNIGKTIKNLSFNPPIGLNRLRKVNYYRSNYKIVKIQSIGIKIKNKKISLRPFTLMLDNRDEREARSWNIFSAEDLKKLGDTKLFYSELKKITEHYLLDAGRFGYVVNIYKKQEFDKEIKDLKNEFVEFIKGENRENKNNRFYKLIQFGSSRTEDNLQSILDNSRELLIEYLLKASENDRKLLTEIYKKDRLLLLERNQNGLSEEEARRLFIKRYIVTTLKFPTPKDIIDRIDVKVDYFDISDELINDNIDFKKVIYKYNIHHIKQLEIIETSEIRKAE